MSNQTFLQLPVAVSLNGTEWLALVQNGTSKRAQSSQISSGVVTGLVVGVSGISGGANGDILYDNNGVLGEKPVTGIGSVVLATSPVLVTPALGTPSSGILTNATGLPLTTGVTGVLGPTNGGTGQASYATGDILYASALNTLSRLPVGSNTNILSLVGGVPAWVAAPATGVTSFSAGTTGLTPSSPATGAIVLAGTLAVANGGTGATSSTGFGSVVLSTSPTLVTPNIGAATGASLSVSGQLTSTVATGTAPLVVSSTTNIPNLNASSLSGATFASPGAIGGTTPGAGTFTNLSSSGTVSGAGFSTYLASPPAIGGTAPAAISGTTGTFSGVLQGGGVTTNSSASAGQIGEFISSVVLIGSAIAITSAATVNVTSISLTAGDWDVSGEVWIAYAGSPSAVTIAGGGITTTTATLPTIPATNTARNLIQNSQISGATQTLPLATTRFSLASTTTVFMVGTTTFTGGTSSGYGVLRARRIR